MGNRCPRHRPAARRRRPPLLLPSPPPSRMLPPVPLSRPSPESTPAVIRGPTPAPAVNASLRRPASAYSSPPPRQPPPGRRCCCRRQRYPKNSTGAIAVAVTQVDSVVVAIIRGLTARARRERIVATPGVGMFTPPTRQPPPICIQPCQPIQSFATPRI